VHEHHARAIEALRRRFEPRAEIQALLIIGSVARGDARPETDIDCCFVVTDEEFARRQRTLELSIHADDLADWEGNQSVGGGAVDFRYLRELAHRGPEPARFAFSDSKVVFSRAPDLMDLLAKIPVYPEIERLEKMRSFVSQLPVHLSYLVLGERSKNNWLLAQTAVELVLFAGRLILAQNRVLFPNRKQFMRAVALAPDKPDRFIQLAEELISQPTTEAAQGFYEAVMSYRDWPVPPEGHWARFSRDREMNWLNGPPALADS
jgi:predicted nucleotidyltransferase